MQSTKFGKVNQGRCAAIAMACVLLIPNSVYSGELSAKELNTKGFRLYKREKYAEACRFFRDAIKMDDGYALAHYNLACTLALRYKLDPCGDAFENGITFSKVLDHLGKSVYLDKGRKKKMQNDADLDPIRRTPRYNMLLHL